MEPALSFIATNSVERLLEKGISPASQEFLVELLRSDLLVLGTASALPEGGHNLSFRTVGTKSGERAVFAFTSASAFSFYRSKFELPEMDTMELHAEDFFSAVCKTYDVVINYGHAVSPYVAKGSLVPADEAAPQ